MTLTKLSPTIIIFSLVALLSLMGSLSSPVLSMKTGYDYSTTGNPTLTNQYKDLKCAYLFAAMTHMRFVRFILDDQNTSTKASAVLMGRYNIRAVIWTLYGVADVEIGTLWILLLYINMAQPYHDEYIHNANEAELPVAINHLVLVHDYVAGKMYMELSNARCRPGNQFDSFEQRHERVKLAMPIDHFDVNVIRNEALINCNELNDLLKKNDAYLTYGPRYESLKQRALFLDKLTDNNRKKNKFMDGYGLQISWERSFALLTEYYQDAQKLHSRSALFLPLFPVKTYYKGAFGLLKCITYRLTWKFLFYSNTLTGERRTYRLKQWSKRLLEIQDMLHLQKDTDFVELLGHMDQLGRNVVDVDTVIHKLRLKLHLFDIILQCDATNPWTPESQKPPLSGQ